MKFTIENIRKKIKPKKINYGNNFSTELDYSDEKISVNPISTHEEIEKAQKELGFVFPPSFKSFLLEVGNGLEILKGNELTVLPLYSDNENFYGIVDLTNEIKSYDYMVEEDFVCFGMPGVTGEIFAFFTGYRYKNGEYPIVWMIPGEIDKKTFCHINDRFDAFLTSKYYSLIDFKDLGYGYDDYSKWISEDEWDEEKDLLELQKKMLEYYDIKGIKLVIDNFQNLMNGRELIDIIKDK